MNGFVLAMGRSGTMWVAAALAEAGSLDARHESCESWERRDSWGEVEVNSFLWQNGADIRREFPDVPIIHLVRDGRDVVRSVMNRKRPGRTLEDACRMWRNRNVHLRMTIPKRDRYRLEDLTTNYQRFVRLAERLKSPYVRRWVWDRMNDERVNRNKITEWPAFRDWSSKNRDIFWAQCGKEMRHYGYGG